MPLPVLKQTFLLLGRLAVGGLVLGFCCGVFFAQDRVDDFRLNCVSCHTIGGGRLVGPDLRDVVERKDRDWLVRFIMDPPAMISSGDPYAVKLKDEARGVVMPAVPGMTSDRAKNLLDLIVAESALEKSQFEGVKISERPFTVADVTLGRDLFLGHQRLQSKAAPCVSCHSVNGLGFLGGSKLGPDLNGVFERLNGRKGLVTWLSAPATPTMQTVFKDHPLDPEEILPLTAFLADKAADSPESGQSATLTFLLLGLTGTAFTLILFDVVWRKRLRGVRRPLVHQNFSQRKG